MNIRLVSDLHLEFDPSFRLPVLASDDQTVLVLAGDIAMAARPELFTEFFEDIVSRFNNIIYILGNHEHYNSTIQDSFKNLKKCLDFENLHLMENDVMIIDDTMFIAATLWTDFENRNALALSQARQSMSDYHTILIEDAEQWRRLLPKDTIAMHETSVSFIAKHLVARGQDMKTVVVTHHAPSFQSVSQEIFDADVQGAYASSLENLVIEGKPDLWCHGHIHSSTDYFIENTRVVCNPRGYAPSALNPQFDPNLFIEL